MDFEPVPCNLFCTEGAIFFWAKYTIACGPWRHMEVYVKSANRAFSSRELYTPKCFCMDHVKSCTSRTFSVIVVQVPERFEFFLAEFRSSAYIGARVAEHGTDSAAFVVQIVQIW